MSALLRSFPAVALRAKSSLPLLLLTIPKFNPSKLLHRRIYSSIYASASASSSETLSVASTKQPPHPAAEANANALEWVRRTDFCGELGEPDVGKRVRLCGWVALHRVHGGLTFLTLRDHTGIVQVFFFFSPQIFVAANWGVKILLAQCTCICIFHFWNIASHSYEILALNIGIDCGPNWLIMCINFAPNLATYKARLMSIIVVPKV